LVDVFVAHAGRLLYSGRVGILFSSHEKRFRRPRQYLGVETPMTRTLALTVVAFGASAAGQPYFQAPTAPTPRTCASSRYVIEAALWADALPTDFETSMESGVLPLASWFGCSGGLVACRFRTVLTPVLQNLSTAPVVPALRRDGHRRSFLVHFEQYFWFGGTWSRATVAPGQECFVVAALRAATQARVGRSLSCGSASAPCTTQPPVLISRSCDVVAQDVEGVLPDSTTTWATTRIGAGQLNATPVDVALVDTGIPPSPSGLYGGLAVSGELGLPDFEPGPRDGWHPHGTAMAALIRQAAPNARLRSFRALDRTGVGSLSSVARSVDNALFDFGWAYGQTPRRPLVVNLSVGAPGHFLRPAPLSSGTCSTWEDGAGETLRYVMAVAGELDASGPAVFISASSGNSVLERAASTESLSVGRGSARTPCSSLDVAPAKSSFIPAAFGESPSCRGGLRRLPVLPVGASTWADTRSTLTQVEAAPLLLAPGERVYADTPSLPRAPSSIGCNSSADISLAKGFEGPMSVSGTSASAALVSAGAARLIGLRPGGPRTTTRWTAGAVASLLYVSGSSVRRWGPSGTLECAGPQRRLSLARAEFALTSGATACESLRACATGVTGVDAPMLSACVASAAACLGTPTCLAPSPEPSWEAAYSSWVAAAAPVCRTPRASSMPPPRQRGATLPDVHLAGLGPQPAGSGCPNCAVRLVRDPSPRLMLLLELSDVYEGGRVLDGAEFTELYVELFNENKETVDRVALERLVFTPGQVVKLDLPLTDRAEAWARGLREGRFTVQLDMAVTTRSTEERFGRMVSPLSVVE
jgi:hypothetical protein